MNEFIYGRRPVCETLKVNRRIFSRLFVLSSIATDSIKDILTLANERKVVVERKLKHELDRLAKNGNHQGIIAEVSSYPYVDEKQIYQITLAQKYTISPLLIICDHIQDPQNLGTILRVADSAGVNGVIIPKDRSAEVTPAVVRASAGAAEHIIVAKVVNIARTIAFLKDRSFWVAGLDCNLNAVLYETVATKDPLAIVVGEEGKGLSRLVKEKCDCLLHIPMYGKINSMNVATALAVVLHEIKRQSRNIGNLNKH